MEEAASERRSNVCGLQFMVSAKPALVAARSAPHTSLIKELQMKSKIRRRDFLKAASVAAAGITFMKPESVFGTSANSAVQLGVIGCGGRGTHVATSFMNSTDTRVVAIAELFADRLKTGKDHFNQLAREKK